MTGGPRDWAVWHRAPVGGGPVVDLLHAQLVRRSYARHIHEEYSLGACTSGLEAIWYRGRVHHSGPGTIVLLEPGEVHTGAPAEEFGFAYRVLYPSAALFGALTALTDHGGAPHFREPVVDDPELAGRLRAAHAALSRGDDPVEGEDRLTAVLGTLVGRHAGADRSRRGASRAAVSVARPVMVGLADRLTAPPSLAEIAADLGLSRFQLVRSFRAEVGMPPYAWLAQYRVSRARGLLERGARPAEAAAQVGFADQAHLTRWFRRVVGVTPGEFRNSVQDSRPGRG